jgi:hypothetical protein
MVLALAALYLNLGGLPWMQGMFYGIGAAVIAIIGRSAYKLVRSTLAKDWLLWSIFAVSALVTAGRNPRSSGFLCSQASSPSPFGGASRKDMRLLFRYGSSLDCMARPQARH